MTARGQEFGRPLFGARVALGGSRRPRLRLDAAGSLERRSRAAARKARHCHHSPPGSRVVRKASTAGWWTDDQPGP